MRTGEKLSGQAFACSRTKTQFIRLPFTLIELLVNTACKVRVLPSYHLKMIYKNDTSLRQQGRTSRIFDNGQKCSSHLHIFTQSAFTLIELLVVIAIIAILAGMLMPALSKARDRGKAISCTAKLKNIMATVPAYAEAYNGMFPNAFVYDGSSMSRWYQRLHLTGFLKLKRNDYYNDVKKSLLDISCPAAPESGSLDQTYGMHYLQPSTFQYYNTPYMALHDAKAAGTTTYATYYINFNSGMNKGLSKMALFMDSMTPLNGKGVQYYVSCCNGATSCGGMWHNNRMNAAFADGHIGNLNQGDMAADDIRIRYAGYANGMVIQTRSTY